jgi:hypothetical protein
VATDPPSPNEYAVRVYDTRSGRRLVAAVELVSPANKDLPEHRRAFVANRAALLQEQVCVAIVDVVTTRSPNLYAELLDLLGQADPSLSDGPPSHYAVSGRWSAGDPNPWTLEAWVHPLSIGLPLPTLPLWVAEGLAVPLDLEKTTRSLAGSFGSSRRREGGSGSHPPVIHVVPPCDSRLELWLQGIDHLPGKVRNTRRSARGLRGDCLESPACRSAGGRQEPIRKAPRLGGLDRDVFELSILAADRPPLDDEP